MRLILSKVIPTRTRSATTLPSFRITPEATWHMRPLLTSTRTADNTKKTFTTCGYHHREVAHPRRHLQRVQLPHRRLLPHRHQRLQRLPPPQLPLLRHRPLPLHLPLLHHLPLRLLPPQGLRRRQDQDRAPGRDPLRRRVHSITSISTT